MFMFSDGKEVAGVQDPLQFRHMKLCRWSLSMLAAWPKKEIGEPESKYSILQNVALLLHALLCFLGTILYVKEYAKTASFYNIGHMYITIFMNCVAISRLIMTFFKKYKVVSAFFIQKIHLIYHKDKSPYAMETHILVHKMSHFFTMYLHFMMAMGILLFNLTPLYKNYRAGLFSDNPPANVSFEHAVYYLLPFDCYTDKNGYLVVFTFNWNASYFCSACFCTFDLFLSVLVFHLWGHLRILRYNFANFPRPNAILDSEGTEVVRCGMDNYSQAVDMYTPAEMNRVFKLLEEYIEHHKLILDFNASMSEIFGPIIFIYYMFHQITGCLLLLLVSQLDPDALAQYGPLTLIIFQQLIQLSIVFELVGSMSERLIQAVYDVPWECMDSRGRKIVAIVLMKVQLPIHLKALGMADVGVNTMASILKTSFSYFTFLRTVSE